MLMRTSSCYSGSHNRFLSNLRREDGILLETLSERVTVAPGMLLVTRGAAMNLIYFPETAIISIGDRAIDGHHVETAVVGCEGIVGWSAIFGLDRSPYDAVVQLGGTALCVSREDIQQVCAANFTLRTAAMRFADYLAVQMAETIVSVLRDTVERRLCRWLLMRHDRMQTDQLRVRHSDISDSLGTRRASVTDCLHVLEGERLIRCYRGRIVIRDRLGLERAAAGSYGAAEAYYSGYAEALCYSTPNLKLGLQL